MGFYTIWPIFGVLEQEKRITNQYPLQGNGMAAIAKKGKKRQCDE